MQLNHEIISDDQHMQLYYAAVEAHGDLLPAHWHEHLEILCIQEGGMTAHTGENSLHLSAGDIFIANPGDIHFTHSDSYCFYYMLQIPPAHLKRIGDDWKIMRFQEYIPGESADTSGEEPSAVNMEKILKDNAFSLIDFTLNRQLNDLFTKIHILHKAADPHKQLLLLAKVYELLYLLSETASISRDLAAGEGKLQERERIEQCMDYVQEHYQEQITLSDAASLLSVSPEHFCRMFRRQTGQTFLAYISQVRLHHFYQDLLHTDQQISFLLDRHGITNYKVFLKQFRDAYGGSPQQIRKEAAG